jgi:hypothetical protein
MRANSYVLLVAGRDEPEVGIIRRRINPHCFIVAVGEMAIKVSRNEIVRLTPRQRRNYRNSQRGN